MVSAAAVLSACSPLASADEPDGRSAVPAAVVGPAPRKPPLVPASGAYLGLFYGSGSVRQTVARLGVTPAVHLTYFGWDDDWVHATSTGDDLAAGRIPLVNWEPGNVDFHDIVDGTHDALVTARARAAARVPHRFFLDFAAEMNEEEGWGGHDPKLYVAAWRHLHDLFTAAGATNVVWVWAPNNTDSADAPPALAYYPGAAYVDWAGIDGYNWGTSRPGFTWQSFAQVFAPMYDQLAALGKPIMIGETASDEVGGSKAAWIAGLVPTLQRRFPAIRAVVWFDVDKERHWQIGSSGSTRAAFTATARNPFWQRAS